MKKKRKLIMAVVLVVVILAGLFAVKMVKELMTLREYRQIISEMTIQDVDLSKTADGIYTGHCEAIWVAADVEVSVKDHRITGIRLVSHKNGRGKPAEVIPQHVVEKQSLQVDVISGVTSSSKVILKAIENALNSKTAQ